MTALELYQYIQENEIEWRYQLNDQVNEDDECNDANEDVIIFIDVWQIESFSILFSRITEESEPFIFHFNGEYFAIYMADICNYYEIDMKQVFKQN